MILPLPFGHVHFQKFIGITNIQFRLLGHVQEVLLSRYIEYTILKNNMCKQNKDLSEGDK